MQACKQIRCLVPLASEGHGHIMSRSAFNVDCAPWDDFLLVLTSAGCMKLLGMWCARSPLHARQANHPEVVIFAAPCPEVKRNPQQGKQNVRTSERTELPSDVR